MTDFAVITVILEDLMKFFTPKAKHIIVTGHFGSGKTNVAVNMAFMMAKEKKRICIADMDIVNPYFRTADDVAELKSAGVRCIIPEFANTNVDIPSLPAEIYSIFASDEDHAILDVGGDDTGAVALGMYSHYLEKQGYEMLYVVNCYRPLTPTADDAIALMRDIEERSRLRCTGIINNSNIGKESDVCSFEESFAFADEIAKKTSLPMLFDTTCLDYINESRNIVRISDMTKRIWDN